MDSDVYKFYSSFKYIKFSEQHRVPCNQDCSHIYYMENDRIEIRRNYQDFLRTICNILRDIHISTRYIYFVNVTEGNVKFLTSVVSRRDNYGSLSKKFIHGNKLHFIERQTFIEQFYRNQFYFTGISSIAHK